MQETRNNCFWSKKCSTTFCQVAVIFQHSCFPVFPDEGSCYVFLAENNCCEFLAFYGLFFQSVINHFSKQQFLVLHCCLLFYKPKKITVCQLKIAVATGFHYSLCHYESFFLLAMAFRSAPPKSGGVISIIVSHVYSSFNICL